jgi:hypothetical protein
VNEIIGYARAGAFIGRIAFDRTGRQLGRIADLVAEPSPDGQMQITAVIVAGRPWGRLLGYEREQDTGPRLIQLMARAIMHKHVKTIPWAEFDHSR